MVSQRQKLARKRYKEEHPELFPKPEPTPPKDPNKRKKKKSLFKKKKSDPKDPNKVNKKGFGKHPLRVPGMKPGDSCFICKAKDHIAKLCPQKDEWEKNKFEYLLSSIELVGDKHCVRYAICLQYGCGIGRKLVLELDIVSRLCDEGIASSVVLTRMMRLWIRNCVIIAGKQGIHFLNVLNLEKMAYAISVIPLGGCCKICDGVTHLAKDCPDKDKRGSAAFGRGAIGREVRPTGRVTKFISGDELDDDFMTENTYSIPKDDGKSKKKQGPKVVTFANAASGMAVDDSCKLKFLELKSKRNYRFIIFKIESQQVVVEKLGSPEETYEDFAASLPADECRYAVFDYDFITNENCQKSKIFFIAWSPDTSRVRSKMVYASSKDRFKRELDGIQVELQATDPSEMSFDIIKSRAL
ncbi:unnamed protein product [Dovyalis caffra]|uniref:ADF-H domain-containing protein n=1 Tax=Dovyalis caffra TaxID=77055 RepID=A0AAV1RPE9_9ROSI|nr:unnamed protein product [Dovyalis caffra]